MLRLLFMLATTSNQASIDAALLYGSSADECSELEVWEQPYDCPERMRWALLTISNRETIDGWAVHRVWVGRHLRDSHHEDGLWRKGHRDGTLSQACPFHWTPTGMSTVSGYGMIYTYNVERLRAPLNCVPWWMMAFSGVAVHAAAERYLKLCEVEPTGRSWCPRLSAIIGTIRRYEDRRETPPTWERSLREVFGRRAGELDAEAPRTG
jgi:hypothetical protein